MLRRRFLSVLVVAVVGVGVHALSRWPAAAADDRTDSAVRLVQQFTSEGVGLLEQKAAAPESQAQQFRSLLEQYFAMEAIGRWVLGRYWNSVSAAECERYLALFEDLVVYGYVKRFSEYTGERVQIIRAVDSGDNTMVVFSRIMRPSGEQPIAVDWRVGRKDTGFRITDVVIENVSLSQTWRSDFAGVLQQNGGSIAQLLAVMEDRVRALKSNLGIGR